MSSNILRMTATRGSKQVLGRSSIVMLVLLSWSMACGSAGDAGGASDARTGDGGLEDAESATHPIGDLGPGLSTLVGDERAGLVDGDRQVSLFNNPVNVMVAANGDILVADFDNGVVRQVTPTGLTTTLVQQAGFSRPFGMTQSASGELYIQTDNDSAGDANGALWRVDPGTGDATLLKSGVGRVRGLASLSDGRVVLADKFAHTVRIYDPALDLMSPLAGLANAPGFSDGTGAAARFDEPLDVVTTSDDLIFVADSQNHRIRQITLAGVVTTFAGTGASASLDGPALSASFETPVGLALGNGTDLFVSEFASGLTREIRAGMVMTIAGSTQGFADHLNPLLGKINVSEGLAYSWPYLYLADGNGGTDAPYHRVRRIDLSE